MNWNLKENNKQKHQFRSYYCVGCRQRKPCQLLTGWDSKWQSYCCNCYYENEQEKAKEYNSFKKVLISKQKEQLFKYKQYRLLKDYQGCKDCGSLAVDAYSLYENSQLVCQPCRMKKEGGASSPISFLEQEKWYKRYWKIIISEWLENFSCLPVNKNCADKWLKDKEHLNSCDCLEIEAKNLVDLFTGSLKEYQEKLEKCACKTSEKVRVDSDYYAWCEKCEGSISAASKKRVIKNRNNPNFWGVGSNYKILCLECIGKEFYNRLSSSKRKTFNKYLRRGYE